MLTNACFISYRREVGEWIARSLFEELRDNDIDAFLDLEGIGQGDFRQIIDAQIRRRPYFLLLLTPFTLQRCREPEDVLLTEIETAVAAGRRLIPVQTESFRRQDITDCLPPDVAATVRYANAVPLSNAYFRAGFETLLTMFLRPVDVEIPEIDANLAAGAERLLEGTKKQQRIEPNVLAAQAHFEKALTLVAPGANHESIRAQLDQMCRLLQETRDPTRWKAEADRRLVNLPQYAHELEVISQIMEEIAQMHHQRALNIARNLRY